MTEASKFSEEMTRARQAHDRAIGSLANQGTIIKVTPVAEDKGIVSSVLFEGGQVVKVSTTFSPTEYGIPGYETFMEYE